VLVKIDKARFLLALKGDEIAVGEVRNLLNICVKNALNAKHLLTSPAQYLGYSGHVCEDVIEDIAQDCFVDIVLEQRLLWPARLSGGDEFYFYSYLLVAVKNFIIDRQRLPKLQEESLSPGEQQDENSTQDIEEQLAARSAEAEEMQKEKEAELRYDLDYDDLLSLTTTLIDASSLAPHRKERLKRMLLWLSEEKDRVVKPIMSDFCKLDGIANATGSEDVTQLRDFIKTALLKVRNIVEETE
jgi:DNA-directed RNA polymerase specialized sigma24 family protein